MKSLLLLWQRVAADAATQCRTSASRDSKRIAARFEHEGDNLLAITLPNLGKAFEKALDEGQVTPELLSLAGSQSGFPKFLQGFLELVFRRCDGRLLDNPSIDAIQAVRQLTLMFNKILSPCTSERRERALSAYVECDRQVKEAMLPSDHPILDDFRRIATLLLADVLQKIDLDVYNGDIVPKHGPGTTADKLRNNAKYRQVEWTERLEMIFPAGENIIPNFRSYHSLDDFTWLEPGAERPVKVITVPKTMKTPRIIAVEPTCMQYMQQGLMERFVEYLERDDLVQDMVGFTDQTPNQRLACEGSRKLDLATLDLSEASDRVSMQHICELLANTPWLLQAADAVRSQRADVPGHGIIPLFKYASMGSALTFPLEECVFLVAVFMGVEKTLNRRLTRRDVKSFSGKVRVYGDDIIVPVDCVLAVVRSLESLGFKVNRDKSFWTGKFRESCGKEYYDGHDVSVCRVRRVIPSHRYDAPGVISAVALRNQFYSAGYWGSAAYLDRRLGELIPFPTVGPNSPVLGRHSVLGYDQQRSDPNLQLPMVWGLQVRYRTPISRLEGDGALLKFFLKRGREPIHDRKHLERQGRPEAVGTKLGWGRAY